MKSGIAELGELVYETIFRAPSFKNVHDELLDNVLPAVKGSDKKRVLVMGIGPSGSPYNTVPDKFRNLFKDSRFKLVFLDYSPKILASCFSRYNELRIIGEEGLEAQIIANERDADCIKKKLKKNSYKADIKTEMDGLEDKLTFFQHDLRDPLPQELGKFDVIESTFTLHHAAQYVGVLADRLKEIYDMLDENGVFHWGTGFCDMSYSEKKVIRIGQEAASIKGYPVVLIDKRADYPYKLTFSSDDEVKIEKYDISLKESEHITIDNKGLVHIPERFLNNSSFFGYWGASFPLIDENEKEDKAYLLKPVKSFYIPTNIEIARLRSIDPELVSMAVEADKGEKSKALKGLDEYYRSEGEALELLYSAGFKRVVVKRPNSDGKGFDQLVNILAYKK
ncbi:class I SAM-dependent methyltransferase [Candidatus Woesearchaeota archaeon]|nr:class I SAM-dependent methyltransferase [Candidatus Woesearchaeota archaeon]